jgi:hypothetical protein
MPYAAPQPSAGPYGARGLAGRRLLGRWALDPELRPG